MSRYQIELESICLRNRRSGLPLSHQIQAHAFGGGGGGTTTTRTDVPPALLPLIQGSTSMIQQVQQLLGPLLAAGVQWRPQQIPGLDPQQVALLDTLQNQLTQTGGSGLMPESYAAMSALAGQMAPSGPFQSTLWNSIQNTLGMNPTTGGPPVPYAGATPQGTGSQVAGGGGGGGGGGMDNSQFMQFLQSILAALQAPSQQASPQGPGAGQPALGGSPGSAGMAYSGPGSMNPQFQAILSAAPGLFALINAQQALSAAGADTFQPGATLNFPNPAAGIRSLIGGLDESPQAKIAQLQAAGANPGMVDQAMGWPAGTAQRYLQQYGGAPTAAAPPSAAQASGGGASAGIAAHPNAQSGISPQAANAAVQRAIAGGFHPATYTAPTAPAAQTPKGGFTFYGIR